MHWQHPPQFVLNFPLPLCSIFDTAIDNEIHNCFHISCCISHCHWVTTTAISWQLHTSLHNSPEYFPPPSTTESTSCSYVHSPTSKHNCFDYTIHNSCCIPPVVINQPRVVLLLLVQPANTTATGIDNCFHCYDTTTDYMLFTQQAQHLAQFKFNFPFYNCNFYWVPEQLDFRKIHRPTDQLSPAGLTSVKYTT